MSQGDPYFQDHFLKCPSQAENIVAVLVTTFGLASFLMHH